jgi:hypothetical protein
MSTDPSVRRIMISALNVPVDEFGMLNVFHEPAMT